LKVEKYLEQKLDQIKITETRESYIRTVVKSIANRLHQFLPELDSYRLCGSFSRYTSIKGSFDVDVYFIGNYYYPDLNATLERCLRQLEASWNPFEIAGEPPFWHAIQCVHNNDVELDCVMARRINDTTYEIPEGDSFIRTTPDKADHQLENANRKYDGHVTKLIRLLKYWKYLQCPFLKSFLIEKLTIQLFNSVRVPNHSEGFRLFFDYLEEFTLNNRSIVDGENRPLRISGNRKRHILNVIAETNDSIRQNRWADLFEQNQS
jgi:hypothetical protein